jgi:hypothetical protein
MSICSSGVSRKIAGVADGLVIDQAYIQSILPAGLAWAYPYLPFMQGLQIGDVDAFCAADPPTWTTPTGDQIFAFLAGGPLGDYQVVNQFLQDVTRAFIWYHICECATVATPAAPAAPSAPSGLPAINPSTVVTLPPSNHCAAVTFTQGPLTGGNVAGLTTVLPCAGSNVTGVKITIAETINSGAGFVANFSMKWFDSAAIIRSDPFLLPPLNSTRSFILPGPPAGAISGQVAAAGTGGGGSSTFVTTLEYFCNGAIPGGNQSSCCPPDPSLTALLARIDQMVTLIQRQSSPFAYVYGSNHAGLSGADELSVSGLIGVSIDITTLPGRVGRAIGAPDHLFDVGYVTLGTDDGWSSSRRVDADGSLILCPPGAGAMTRVGYSFTPGVVADIRELLREP